MAQPLVASVASRRSQDALKSWAVTGAPFAPQAAVQLPQGRRTINIAPPDGSYRLPSQDLLYLRFSKILFRRGDRRVEVAAELANALQNEAANAVVSQNFYAATFNQAAAWIEPRKLYFMMKAWF